MPTDKTLGQRKKEYIGDSFIIRDVPMTDVPMWPDQSAQGGGSFSS